MPDRLLSAVIELTRVVKSLENTLKTEYPKRREIEENYSSKKELRKRRNQFIIFVVLAIVCSYLLAVVTISGCFLSTGVREGHAASVCSALPGYHDTSQRSNHITHQFERLLKKTDHNERRIERLERKLLK